MAASPSSELQQKRLLRMTIAHYRKEDCAEEDFYRWATEVYTPQAVKILTKHGLEAFQYHLSPASFRGVAKAMNTRSGDRWVIRDHDIQAEFYFRDPAVIAAISADPDFRALQATEVPYVSMFHTESSIGWIETYIQDGKVVNITEDGKSGYLGWAAMSAAS